ncbi:MAG TPA: phosphotransferase [Roseiflexaceae bacterium]|nr:phosphotransferase [Roseiflexaceae bacterium]
MKPFQELNSAGQVRRLAALGQTALRAYGMEGARLRPLQHAENTTFRLAAPDGRQFVLRVHRTGRHSPEQVRSEMAWLAALRRDTDLLVPCPQPTADGDLLTVAEAPGVPEPRICVLFEWMEGRFRYDSLTPARMEAVGGLIARLHLHAEQFVPPPGFHRWRGDEISDLVRISTDGMDAVVAHVAGLVGELIGPEHRATVEAVAARARAAQTTLGEGPDAFGLVHGDLHQWNYLFAGERVAAIDFDDCGYAHYLYDLAVTAHAVGRHPRADALRAGLLAGYRRVRNLPAEHEPLLDAFVALRRLQLMTWEIEQREAPAFRDSWHPYALEVLAQLAA